MLGEEAVEAGAEDDLDSLLDDQGRAIDAFGQENRKSGS